MTVESNVAAALNDLMVRCGASDYQMWEALRLAGRDIHSYHEFEDALVEAFGCDDR